MNPVEGVMCWACYTPLTGGASAAGAAGMGAAAKLGGSPGLSAPPDLEEKPKAKVSPVQMGVIGVALVVLLGMGLRSMNGPALPDVPPDRLPDVPGGTRGGPSFIPPSPGQPAPQPPQGGPQTGDPVPEMTYSVTTPPSVKSSWATVGIVPEAANTDRVMAGRLASLAHQRYSKTGKWEGIYVYAFADKQTASVFQKYQQSRRGAPLEPGDYDNPSLQSIWPKTLARYEFSKGQEAIRYPQVNPTAWFAGSSNWSKAAR